MPAQTSKVLSTLVLAVALFVPTAVASGAANPDSLAPGPATWTTNHPAPGSTGTLARFAADVTGDGRADAVVVRNGNWYVAASSGSSFGAVGLWASGLGGTGTGPAVKRMLGDVNCDGRADAVAVVNGTWTAAPSTGTGFGAQKVLATNFFAPYSGIEISHFLADMDANGCADMISVGSGLWTVKKSWANIFNGPVFNGTGGETFWAPFGMPSSGSQSKTLLADVTGDRRADPVSVENGAWKVATNHEFAGGYGFNPTQNWSSAFGGSSADPSAVNMLADVDGDPARRADAISVVDGTWHVALSTGSGFGKFNRWEKAFTPPVSSAPTNVFAADTNNDNQADPISETNGKWFATVNLPIGEQVRVAGSGWTQIFGDEFDSPNLNTANWNDQRFDPWLPNPANRWEPYSNREGANYAASQNTIEDGSLVETIKKLSSPVNGKSYTTGMVNTFGKFSFKHGYVEARIKVPYCVGCWPAFWMMPNTQQRPPEIDVFEFFPNLGGRQPYYASHRTATTYHSSVATFSEDYTGQFHTYGVLWRDNSLRFYFDGMATAAYTDPVEIPTQAMYLINTLQQAEFVPDPVTGLPTTTRYNTPDNVKMYTDYVRVFRYE